MATITRSFVGGTLLACSVVLAGCARSAPAVVDLPPPEVTVSRPVAREVTDYFEFTGQTAAVEEVDVRAQVSGYLVKVNFADGQEVTQGTTLFEIDPAPFQAELDRAQGELARVKAMLVKAEADLRRAKELLPVHAISQEEYDQMVAARAVAEATIQSAEAAVRQAQLNLGFTKVLAPIDGRTSTAAVTVGNLVQSGPGQATVLTRLVSTDPMYVYFNVDEGAMLQYQAQTRRSGRDARPENLKDLKVPVEIGLSNEEGFPHQGVLDFADNKVDPATGTIRARGVFDNKSRYLTAGMFVRVRMPFGEPRRALLVPERALGTDQGQKYLLVVNKDHVVDYRPVSLGSLQERLRVIDGGIEPDELVIVNGLQRVRPGITVKPNFSEQPITTTAGPPSPDPKPSPK